ncbi:MAG: hypothetical protein A2172_03710 [Candidatus Woykebacteria bacterium RBG_13_40_15]|uniref:Uncharacterized protein n=1 Tax=Candidatus Woykebacteria bacterium RBG_13_40_15 TaxID=1802593 RepID=A0A1G1W6R5_9BACT|nr:MAG: hypothetical protein A2172_03710 [Candidatus Woykebacteria bacterium RBG_13_40_15]
MLCEKDQEFLYAIWKNNHLNMPTYTNGEYERVEKLNRLGLIRRLKMAKTCKQRMELTDEGVVLAVVRAREKGEKALDKLIVVGYW